MEERGRNLPAVASACSGTSHLGTPSIAHGVGDPPEDRLRLLATEKKTSGPAEQVGIEYGPDRGFGDDETFLCV